MSDNKMSPVEAAKMILEGAKQILKKNEELLKAANTAHVIEGGAKPTKGAECPDSLASNEHSESTEMEDTPLQDYDGEESDEEKEEEESDEEEYEFKKSESGMHSIEYKRLAKAWLGGTQTSGQTGGVTQGTKGAGSGPSIADQIGFNKDEDGKTNPNISFKRFERGQKKMTDAQQAESKRTAQNPKNTTKKKQDYEKAKGQWRSKQYKATGDLDYLKGNHDSKYDSMKQGEFHKSEGVSVEQAVSMIMSDKHGVDDVMKMVSKDKRDDVMAALREKDTKKAEMCKGYMDKCGEMKAGKKLKKFMEKSKNRCWDGYEPVPGKKPYSEDSCKKK